MRLVATLLVLAVVGGLVLLGFGQRSAPAPPEWDPPDGPVFELDVKRPWAARPLFGLLPGSPLHLDQASPGAEVVRATPDVLELRAEGWHLVLHGDGAGGVGPDSALVFPIELADRDRSLRGLPARPPVGSLRLEPVAGEAGLLAGTFQVELATCEDADTGKHLEWPPAPLTLRGRVAGLPLHDP